jgi:hypothetical protein
MTGNILSFSILDVTWVHLRLFRSSFPFLTSLVFFETLAAIERRLTEAFETPLQLREDAPRGLTPKCHLKFQDIMLQKGACSISHLAQDSEQSRLFWTH